MKWLFGEKCFCCRSRFWRKMNSIHYTALDENGLPDEYMIRVCDDCAEVFRDLVDHSTGITRRAREIMDEG